MPNSFAREIKYISRLRSYYFFSHLFLELTQCLRIVPRTPWTINDITSKLFIFQDLHFITRGWYSLILVSSNREYLDVYPINLIVANSIDDFSTSYSTRQLV